MNLAATSTQQTPLTIGSVETFQTRAELGYVPWDLTGGSATLKLTDPTGAGTTISATITAGNAVANWTVIGPAGQWTRAWVLQDAVGVHQVSLPIAFQVVAAY